MASVNPVLVVNTETDNHFFEIVDIASDNIPQELNGETGFHIYHVRMLTELMLREICKLSDKYSLSDEDDTFENNNILIAGPTHLSSKGKIKVYNGVRIPYEKIFETYDF